jgi:hypothetical protein
MIEVPEGLPPHPGLVYEWELSVACHKCGEMVWRVWKVPGRPEVFTTRGAHEAGEARGLAGLRTSIDDHSTITPPDSATCVWCGTAVFFLDDAALTRGRDLSQRRGGNKVRVRTRRFG